MAVKRNGVATVEKCPDAPPPAYVPSVPGDLEWCSRVDARVRFFKRNGQTRVQVSLDGGISYEGATIFEAAEQCQQRLTRRLTNTGVIRVPRG